MKIIFFLKISKTFFLKFGLFLQWIVLQYKIMWLNK